MPKVSLKSVGQQIRAVQKQLRSSRTRTAPEYRPEIDDLIQKLDGLHMQTLDCCPKGMDGLSVAAAKRPAKSAKSAGKKKTSRPKRRTR
jgi:hypothetical protein